MKCDIKYVGKKRTGVEQYYCTTHKEYASDKTGKMLDECLCNYKELFDKSINVRDVNIESIKIVYSNILDNTVPKVFINNEEFKGVLKYDDSILTYKDFTGTMLARLNNIDLEEVRCNHCKKLHSDNGKFAYMPHRVHLCLYCGHLFRVRYKNIGNELTMIYNILDIKLDEKTVNIDDKCLIEYDLFNGVLLVNGESVNKIIYKGKEISLVDFLNDVLEGEY